MKLYYMPGACSLATHITLEWIGQPYDTARINHDELKQAAYLRVNPAGAVPALEHDGRILTQNVAILNYLADTHPDARLGGDGTPEGRAEVNRWLGIVNSDMHPSFKPFFGATAYLGDEQMIEKTRVQAGKALHTLFERADAQLDGRDWLTGDRSIADPYLYVLTRWTELTGVDIADLAHLAQFRKRMDADAGVKKVLADEGLA